MWTALGEDRMGPMGHVAFVLGKLKGEAADAVWLGAREPPTTREGMEAIKYVLLYGMDSVDQQAMSFPPL